MQVASPYSEISTLAAISLPLICAYKFKDFRYFKTYFILIQWLFDRQMKNKNSLKNNWLIVILKVV